MGIAENIKKRRLELGLSQQELASILGYKSRSTINKIEAGENAVPEVKIALFAKALDTTPEYIRTGGGADAGIRERAVPTGKKTVAVILAGGKSTRNLQNIPNQFINVLGKPVILYVLEAYEKHPAVDEIYVVCLKNWEDIVAAYAKQYGITKLTGIIPAGETGILSVKSAVDHLASRCGAEDTVLIQESTRPLITEEIISKLLHCTGNAIICEKMDDYMQVAVEGGSKSYLDRDKVFAIQSPEKYSYGCLREAFETASREGHTFSETTCGELIHKLGYSAFLCEGNHNNIKVVRQEDIAILNALLKQML